MAHLIVGLLSAPPASPHGGTACLCKWKIELFWHTVCCSGCKRTPPQSAKRSTFNHKMGKTNGLFVRARWGWGSIQVHFLGRKGPHFGGSAPPQSSLNHNKTLESKENYPWHTKTVQNSLSFMPEVNEYYINRVVIWCCTPFEDFRKLSEYNFFSFCEKIYQFHFQAS